MWQKTARALRRRLYGTIKAIEAEQVALEHERIKNAMKSCGSGVGIWGKVYISGAGNICLGDNVHIGANAYIRAEGGLTVGNNTHISRNLVLYTVNHRIDGERLPYDEEYVSRSVVIGNNVWIGMNVCIVPGARIGDGVVVGMGTVVSGVVPDMSIIASNKWRTIGERDRAHYNDRVAANAYGGPNGKRYVSESTTK